MAVPALPENIMLIRESGHTILRWADVVRDISQAPANIQGYRIYRSNSANLETFDLISTITDLDSRGMIRNVFTENIPGFFSYGISAFNADGEGGKSCQAAINSINSGSGLSVQAYVSTSSSPTTGSPSPAPAVPPSPKMELDPAVAPPNVK